MAAKDFKIPFDKDGNQLDYPAFDYEEKDNFEFEDTLTFEGYGRGRSSVTFTLRRKNSGTTVSMFVSDFAKVVPLMAAGVIFGKFTFVKKGANYGCKIIIGTPAPAAK